MARLLASPVLVCFAFAGWEAPFKWLLLASLLSDTIDGAIARAFHTQSRRGALLDSVADIVLTLATLLGLVRLQWPFVSEHHRALFLIVGIYVLEVALALYRYGRVSSFHTYLARVAAYAQAVFVLSLFFLGDYGWLFYLTVIVSVIAYVEELVLLYFLPNWTSDVRGLYWVFTDKRFASRLRGSAPR
jgi:CDP-diacylglycerol--glycerol-3-phosphate 3-phosphatidyltransferase